MIHLLAASESADPLQSCCFSSTLRTCAGTRGHSSSVCRFLSVSDTTVCNRIRRAQVSVQQKSQFLPVYLVNPYFRSFSCFLNSRVDLDQVSLTESVQRVVLHAGCVEIKEFLFDQDSIPIPFVRTPVNCAVKSALHSWRTWQSTYFQARKILYNFRVQQSVQIVSVLDEGWEDLLMIQNSSHQNRLIH